MTFSTITAIDSMKNSQLDDNRDEVFADLNIKLQHQPGTHKLITKVDTGAQGNILPLQTYRRMFPQDLDAEGFPKPGATTHRSTILTAYNGTNIPQCGTILIPCGHQPNTWRETEFFVADSDGPN